MFRAAWSEAADDGTVIGWARSSWTALRRFATGGVYVNFAGLGDETDGAPTFGASALRLEEVRRCYDPHGLFEAAAHRP